MIKKPIVAIAILLLILSCSKGDEEKFIPTDVFVKIKPAYTIKETFDFINSFDHTVEYIGYQAFRSNMPTDSLNHALNLLNSKSYTNSGAWEVYGNVVDDYFVIRPRLFGIHNTDYQKDWLESMKLLQLDDFLDENYGGRLIFFHVPKGKEYYWKDKFLEYEMVEYTELNQLE